MPLREASDITRAINMINKAVMSRLPMLLLSTDANKAFDRGNWAVMFAILEHASSEKVLCVPIPPKPLAETVINLTLIHRFESYFFPLGHNTSMELQYYIVINQWCYEHVVPDYSKVFPYLILINSTVLLIAGNFWFKFPMTRSKIEQFVTVLGMCLASPWTIKALSRAVHEESRNYALPLETKASESNTKDKALETVAESPAPIMPSVSQIGNLEQSLTTEQPEDLPKPPQKRVNFHLEEVQRPQAIYRRSKKFMKVVAGKGTTESILDKKEGEQAKALFERVKNFRLHTEKKSLLYYTYKMQALFRLLQATAFLSYVTYHTPDMKFQFHCVEPQNISGYTEFSCVFVPCRMFTMLSIIYLLVLFIYTFIFLYTLYWIFCYKLQEYSFEIIRKETRIDDIPDAINDFSFLLHLIDQYDQLYAWKFAIFLSDVSETKLDLINMNNYWTQEKLRQRLSINSEGKTELRLPTLPGIPEELFQLAEVEVLKLEKIKSATLLRDVSNLRLLKELWIMNCNIKLETRALDFLKKNLHILRVNFSNPDEIPSWMYNLSSLRELYINDDFHLEIKTSVSLQSFKELAKLKSLSLKLHTSSVPSTIIRLAQTLESLTIHNGDFKLSSVSILKKLTNLKHLRLNHCQLDHIPSSIFSLVKLQEVDFSNNNLNFLEELTSLQQLKNLVSLNLSHNNISSIPSHIARVSSLEKLFINNNYLTSISSAVFKLTRLSCLDLSNNEIHLLPEEIGILVDLECLSISHNKLTSLPNQLYSCTKLHTLKLSHNNISIISSLIGELTQLTYLDLLENQLEKLPIELEKCTHLKRNQLLVENMIIDTLPYEVRERMENCSTSRMDVSIED
ncbi:volume-regulated anion channel subunit LRRC8C-like [Bufo gargarizans]|uniref:volume-regulated anion channel subunit LRRC8C-like n=1 Tax=Bufo gargarizans TaxID=30331 RepID=UPI001CF58ADB|nr:volume-regulated anion channel subunit LRRC8C-like [Bufo gargarizans]